MDQLPVIYRKDKEDSAIVAIFPTIWETGNTMLCYAHVGQHGSASDEYVSRNTVPAKPNEYADLHKELTGIYTTRPSLAPEIYGEPVQLAVKERQSPKMREAWRAMAREYGRL